MNTKWESDHLWLCLLAMGFHPKGCHDIRLGRNMFAKPNIRAFSVIAYFLFRKLDKHRATLTFKHYGYRKLLSPEFRKICSLWLKEISKHEEISLPQITPSTLACPGGSKFVHMVYCFARYVMMNDMKKLSVGTGIPFAEAVMWRPEDMYMAEARHRVAYNKLLQVLQREDFLVQEYKKKAQVLIREIKLTESEYAIVQKQSCRVKQNDQNKNNTTEKIQKVRSMWTLIVEMLTSLKKEKEVVDSVLEDCVNPCILDGTNVVLSVPGLLTWRVESNIRGFCTGNLYEDGKLNFLTVIQLLNEALMALRDEQCLCELKELDRIEDVVTSYKNVLQELNTRSLRRKQQCCEPKCQSISRKQEFWESKWKSFLGQCPLNLIFEDDPQPASSLQSPSSSSEDENTVCYQSFSDNDDSCHEECHGKNDETLKTTNDTALVPSTCDFIQRGNLSASEATDSCFLSPILRPPVPSLSEAPENGDLIIENNLHTYVGNKHLASKNLKKWKEEFPTSEVENAGENVTQPKSPVKKDDLLLKAKDELAEEVAKLVMSESPDSGEEKGMVLEDLISSLCFNPFITRKQIPRTPENLLTEIRSSWRKAIQTEGSLDLELSSTKVVTEESSMNATPSMQEQVDSTFVCSEHASPVSDCGPLVSEKKSQLSMLLNSVGHEITGMSILNETLPECDGIDLSLSASPDSVFCEMCSEDLTDVLENNEDEKFDLDIQMLSNSHEVLKRTASKSEEELHQTHNGDKSEGYRHELTLTLEEEDDRNYHDCSMDEGFTKMPLPNSPNESKYSLSLLVSCQQMDGI
ncbi:LOW QUALITY PROTEIN: HAUS augmin-like complex subunit 6 [Sylvia borin]